LCEPVPVVVGLYLVVHVAEAPAPDNVQVVNVPVLFVESVIVPVGVKAGVGDVSVTVTVQVAALLTSVVAGQLIAIALVLSVEVTVPLVPPLVECTLSP
jgi:hypothetical protein